MIELDTGRPASDWRSLGTQAEVKLWRRVRHGHLTGCVGEEISLQWWLGIIWYKHCKTLSYCTVRRRAGIETTLLEGLRQRQRETREVNMAQELSLWSPERETVLEEEHSHNNSKTQEGRGRCRKGRKLYCVLSILLQAWLQEYSGSRILKNVRNQCCARQWRNARN